MGTTGAYGAWSRDVLPGERTLGTSDPGSRAWSGARSTGGDGVDGVTWWCPAEGHPDGPSTDRWFERVGSMVYPAHGHPDGASDRPWYQLRGACAHAIDAHPCAGAALPWFRRAMDLWFAAAGHDQGASREPWFREVEDDTEAAIR